MRRNVVFEKGRDWRVQDTGTTELDLRPGRGAAIGEYAAQESSEFSDAFYGPGDDYPRQGGGAAIGYSRGEEDPSPPYDSAAARSRGAFRASPRDDRSYGTVHSYGDLHEGGRSWADLGVSTTPHERERSTAADYRGRGPKGYTRTDERLTEIICEQLTHDPHIDASEITVQVKSGCVTLSGAVPDRRTKWEVEELVDSCRGVTDIDNRLRVRRAQE